MCLSRRLHLYPFFQTALFNPFTLVSECFGPKICGHLKHLVCCAAFLAIIVFGAPVFNAIIPIVRSVVMRPCCSTDNPTAVGCGVVTVFLYRAGFERGGGVRCSRVAVGFTVG